MRVLVVGSYPPVPGAAAASTLAAVERSWADGDEVEVLSPRPSAAHRHAVLSGYRAAWSLLKLSPRADALVLCVEPGMPFAPMTSPRPARALALALRRFRHVAVQVVGAGQLDKAALAPLWPAVHEVVVPSPEASTYLVSVLGVPAARVRVDFTAAWSAQTAEGDVTPLGPPDWTMREQPRRLASMVARRLLGSRTDVVRAQVVRLLRAARPG